MWVPAFAGMTSLLGWRQEIPASAGIEMRSTINFQDFSLRSK